MKTQTLFAWYATGAKIEEEIAVLKDTQCAVDANPSACAGAVDAYWPVMGAVMFTSVGIIDEVCAQTADCPTSR